MKKTKKLSDSEIKKMIRASLKGHMPKRVVKSRKHKKKIQRRIASTFKITSNQQALKVASALDAYVKKHG